MGALALCRAFLNPLASSSGNDLILRGQIASFPSSTLVLDILVYKGMHVKVKFLKLGYLKLVLKLIVKYGA